MMEVDDSDNNPASQYGKQLLDLKMNSKPVINVLTMMAEDFIKHAPVIVTTIEKHLNSVHPNVKLPVLYLIDSIVKNVGQDYPNLFTQNIVSTFCGVFEKVQKVDDKVKQQMFKLRQTWNDVFPQRKLYAIDVRCHQFDRNWPISAPPPTNASSSIHVNPKFLNTAQPGGKSVPSKQSSSSKALVSSLPAVPPAVVVAYPMSSSADGVSPVPQDAVTEAHMRAKLLQKQKELLELQQKKIELELMQTKSALESKRIEEMQSAMQQEKMLLGQAEKAKSKTDIANKILSTTFPSSSSQSLLQSSSSSSSTTSSITMPAVAVSKYSRSPTPQQHHQPPLQVAHQSLVPAPQHKTEKIHIHLDDEKGLKEHRRGGDKDKHSKRDRGSSKDRNRKRSSSSSSKDEKETKIRRSDGGEKSHSLSPAKYVKSPGIAAAALTEEMMMSSSSSPPLALNKRTKSSKGSSSSSRGGGGGSSSVSSKDSSSSTTNKGKSGRSSRDGSSSTGSSPREKLTRSPSKHGKKNAAIKQEESFHARRFAVLKRNYRKTGGGGGMDGDDEENKIPPSKMSRGGGGESQDDQSTHPPDDVDLRYQQGHHSQDEADNAAAEIEHQQQQGPIPPLMKKPIPRPGGNGSNMIVDLFGREDVDLRQPPARLGGGNWVGGAGHPPPSNWGQRMLGPGNQGGHHQGSWIGPGGPNRAGPRGPNPFEEALIDPNEQLRAAERDGPGSNWVPNPRAINLIQQQQQRWGPGAPPPFIAIPRGPNPFEEALGGGGGDHFNPPHLNEMEMMRAGPGGDRGSFIKALRGRRGGARGRRGGGGPGRPFMMEQFNPNLNNMNMPPHHGGGNFQQPPPLFMDPDHQQQRGPMLQNREPFPFTNSSNSYEFNSNEGSQQQDHSAPELSDAEPASTISSTIQLPDVTSLLEMATRLGFLTSTEPQSVVNTETEPVKSTQEVELMPPPATVPEMNNKPKESAIAKYQKYQKYQRNNRNNNKRSMVPATPVVEVIPPPLPTVDVLLVTEEKNYFKERRQALINQMWIGVQCSMCGLRFPPDQKKRYSEHLQWHFRRNRKEKENAKKAQSRAWHYKKTDWLKFEEVEDLDERATSLFEMQDDADQKMSSPGTIPEECSVVASGHEGAHCPQCGEKFNSKYDEDKEEWRLVDAILEESEDGEENIYHYLCHQDYLKSMQEETLQHESMEVDLQNKTEQEEEKSCPSSPSTAVEAVAAEIDEPSSSSPAPPPPPLQQEDDDDDEVLILKEGKKEVVVMEIDVVDDEDGVISEETNQVVKNKEIENGPDSPKDSKNTATLPIENISDNINSSSSSSSINKQQPVFNYSIYSRSPITVNDDDDSSSNLLPGICPQDPSSAEGGVFAFALNSGIIRRERSESPDQANNEKKIIYKSMEFDFPKIKIEPPDSGYEEMEKGPVAADESLTMVGGSEELFFSSQPTGNVVSPGTAVAVEDPMEPIDLTGEDDSMDATDGPMARPLHQTTSIDGNLHQEVHLAVPFVPPAKIRINMDFMATSPKPGSSPKPNASPNSSQTQAVSPGRSDNNTTKIQSPLQNSDSESSSNNTEPVFTPEMKRLKPGLAKFIESGRKFKNCPPKEGLKEESGLCVIS